MAVDRDRLVVGASLARTETVQGGGVYFFRRENGAWTPDGSYKESNPLGAGAFLGDTVLLFGNSAFIGQDDYPITAGDPNQRRGRMLIFQRGPTDWQLTQTIVPSDTTAQNLFGARSATDGTRLIVTAPRKTRLLPTPGVGVMYCYTNNGSEWVFESRIIPSFSANVSTLDPESIAIDDDWIVAGLPLDGGASNGSVVFFNRGPLNIWNATQRFLNPLPSTGRFGYSVRISGDLAFVGVQRFGMTPPALVYVYRRVNNVWALEQRIDAPFGALPASLATELTYSAGKLYVKDVAVAQGGGQRVLWVYEKPGASWVLTRRTTLAPPTGSPEFLSAPAVSGDEIILGATSRRNANNVQTGSFVAVAPSLLDSPFTLDPSIANVEFRIPGNPVPIVAQATIVGNVMVRRSNSCLNGQNVQIIDGEIRTAEPEITIRQGSNVVTVRNPVSRVFTPPPPVRQRLDGTFTNPAVPVRFTGVVEYDFSGVRGTYDLASDDEPTTLALSGVLIPGLAPRFETPFRVEGTVDLGLGDQNPRFTATAFVTGRAPPGACPVDFNLNGQLDFFDYLDFVQALEAGMPTTDFNGNGTIDFFDYLDFVLAYEAGC